MSGSSPARLLSVHIPSKQSQETAQADRSSAAWSISFNTRLACGEHLIDVRNGVEAVPIEGVGVPGPAGRAGHAAPRGGQALRVRGQGGHDATRRRCTRGALSSRARVGAGQEGVSLPAGRSSASSGGHCATQRGQPATRVGEAGRGQGEAAVPRGVARQRRAGGGAKAGWRGPSKCIVRDSNPGRLRGRQSSYP